MHIGGFSTKKDLIEIYFLLIKEINLDFIIRYNIFMFDFKYIDTRLKRKLINLPLNFEIQGIDIERIDVNWNTLLYDFNDYIIINLLRCTVIDVH